MERVYEDKHYNIPEVTEAFTSCTRQINRHAASLVVVCLNKVYELLIPFLEQVLENLVKKK